MVDTSRIAPFFCFNAPPITDPPLLDHYLRSYLEPILSIIDEFDLPTIEISFSGAVIDSILESRIISSAIRRLVEANKLQLMLSRYYEPIEDKTPALAQASHWQITAQIFETLEIPIPKKAFLPQAFLDIPLAREIYGRGIKSCILPIPSAAPTNLSSLTPLRSYRAPFTDLTLALVPCYLFKPELTSSNFLAGLLDNLSPPPQTLASRKPDRSIDCFMAALNFSTDGPIPNPEESEKSFRVMFRQLQESRRLISLDSALSRTELTPPDLELLKSATAVCFNADQSQRIRLIKTDSNPTTEQATPEEFLMHRMMLDLALEYRATLKTRQNIEGPNPTHGRLASALRFLCRCRDRSYYRVAQTAHTVSPERIRSFFEALLYGTVDVDTATYPDIDPNTGWVFLKALDFDRLEAEVLVVDTQLMRLHFLPALQGSAVTLLYKPRKLNLFPTLSHGHNSFFGPLALRTLSPKCGLVENLQSFAAERRVSTHAADVMISKQTPGLLGIRFSGSLADSVKEFREFTFRAGIGAHLQNATTGFALEYWVEAKTDDFESQLIELSWAFLLPSARPDAASALTLHSVGGISKEALSLDKPLYLSGDNMEGGLYGLRLVDGLNGLTTDWRSAKPLRAVSVSPQFAPDPDDPKNSIYTGSSLRFYIDPKRASDPHSPNTLFLSIV